jgi:pilus assembly protein Flp/PilA
MLETIQRIVCMLQTRMNYRHEERGATAVEYGIMVALIAAVIVVIVGILGGQVNSAFNKVSNALAKAVGP